MITFPLSAANFFAGLKIAEIRFYPEQVKVQNQTRGGSLYAADMGDVLWRGSVSLVAGYHQPQAAIDAMIDVAARAGASFLAYDTRLKGPALDPGGVVLGAATPSVHLRSGSSAFELQIAGLPVGYTLSRGDQIGVTYGGGRRGLWRVVTGGAADGAGRTGWIEVSTPISPLVQAGDPVTLVRPSIKAVLLDAPGYAPAQARVQGGATFDFIQIKD